MTNKIIAAILVLLGFGSCANRPSKSRAPENDSAADSVVVRSFDRDSVPIRVMYGTPYRPFEPQKVREFEPKNETDDSTQQQTATEE